MENCGDHAVLLSWVGDHAHVVAQGEIHDIALLADGRVRVAIDYRSLNAAHSFVREAHALSAMIAEDAAAQLDEALWDIVRDYHDGEGGD
jgi:hypothetical protein